MKSWLKTLKLTGASALAAVLVGLVAGLVEVAQAQQVVTQTPTSNGALGSLANLNEAVTIPVLGTQFASVRVAAPTAGSATFSSEVSIDGGTNYLPSALALRTSIVSANPSVFTISAGFTFTAADVYDIPLPANSTHFRIRCNGAGTATVVSLSPGKIFIPGQPVVAVLYDVTSAVNTPLNTGNLDVSGWIGMSAWFVTSGGRFRHGSASG